MPYNSHALKALNEELKTLQRDLTILDGEVEYHQGMMEMKRRMADEVEDKIHEIGQSIFHLENA